MTEQDQLQRIERLEQRVTALEARVSALEEARKAPKPLRAHQFARVHAVAKEGRQ